MTDARGGDEQRRRAAALDAEAQRARRQAAHYDKGDAGEAYLREVLAPLAAEGWTLLHKRHWPGKRRADLDHVLIGPGGVVVLDTKHWAVDVCLRGGRLFRDQEDATEELTSLVAQVADVEDALVATGLAPLEVQGALVFVGPSLGVHTIGRVHVTDDAHVLRWLRARGARLDHEQVAALAKVVEGAVAPHSAPALTPVPVVRRTPKARALVDEAALFTVAEVDLDELERAAQLPLEQWMTYLHPSQLEVVRRRHSGPSRVRGPAGCGKTVVALHRAAYLAAHEPGDLLVLSFVRTLPGVLASLYARLSPQSADRVRFDGVHRLAFDVLRDTGHRVKVDTSAAQTCFNLAWARVGRNHLQQLPRTYWEEEVLSVIKGRGLTDFDDYRQLSRTGRRTALGAEQRKRVWDLYMEYDRLLSERGLSDFEDVVSLAHQAVVAGAGPRYRFVLVDEVQDLSLMAVRLAAALVTDERDGLTLVGDGQQSLYAGGYTLKEAGLDIRSRSVMLETNYRNTRQILEAAHALVKGDDFDDLEGIGESGDRLVQAVREGANVLVATGQDADSLDVALSLRLAQDRALGLTDADAAVLCRTSREADRLRSYLRREGHPVMDLRDYAGRAVPAIKVGTVKRAKGLEFARVYVPRVDGYLCDDEDAELERVQRERREVFVAITRARDGVWMSRLNESAMTATVPVPRVADEHERVSAR